MQNVPDVADYYPPRVPVNVNEDRQHRGPAKSVSGVTRSGDRHTIGLCWATAREEFGEFSPTSAGYSTQWIRWAAEVSLRDSAYIASAKSPVILATG